jgi:hypothetical protein
VAIPVSDDPARRVVVVPLVLIPTVKTTQDWSFTTGGAVIPRAVLGQRNNRILAWFGGTLYLVDDGAAGEAKPVFYAQDSHLHVELEALTIRTNVNSRQSYITGPLDVTDQIPQGAMVGVRAAARVTQPPLQVSFFHLTLTFMVQ